LLGRWAADYDEVMATALKPRRWTRAEYERLVEQGFFHPDEHLELLDGLMVVREPQGDLHGSAVMAGVDVLRAAFAPQYSIRPQLPMALGRTSEPEPDLAVMRGGPWDYRGAHKAAPVLVVEIAVTSLSLDRRLKGGLYARAGIREYWIVNLVDEVLEVYRQPVRSLASRHGWKYRSVRLLRRGVTVTPLAATKRVAVADLLPPRR
jgi:Uma2 family endonuclease